MIAFFMHIEPLSSKEKKKNYLISDNILELKTSVLCW